MLLNRVIYKFVFENNLRNTSLKPIFWAFANY